MTLQINDRGKNNRIDISPDVLASGTGIVTVEGDHASLLIAAGTTLSGASIHLGPRCRVTIERARLAAAEIHCVVDASITIGCDCSFTWRTQVLAHEPGAIRIGPGCLFATDTLVTSSDMHSVLDDTSRRRLNPARDVTIGAHVWVGFRALVLKGSSIGDDAVIGAGAVVAGGTIPSGCLAAGNPARVLRHGVTWTPELV